MNFWYLASGRNSSQWTGYNSQSKYCQNTNHPLDRFFFDDFWIKASVLCWPWFSCFSKFDIVINQRMWNHNRSLPSDDDFFSTWWIFNLKVKRSLDGQKLIAGSIDFLWLASSLLESLLTIMYGDDQAILIEVSLQLIKQSNKINISMDFLILDSVLFRVLKFPILESNWFSKSFIFFLCILPLAPTPSFFTKYLDNRPLPPVPWRLIFSIFSTGGLKVFR